MKKLFLAFICLLFLTVSAGAVSNNLNPTRDTDIDKDRGWTDELMVDYLKSMGMTDEHIALYWRSPYDDPEELLTYDPNYDHTIHEPYVYVFTHDDEEWHQISSAECHLRCQIPNDILREMDTYALLWTVAEYPFMVDLSLSEDIGEAYNTLWYVFNGIREVERRPDAIQTLAAMLNDPPWPESDQIGMETLYVYLCQNDPYSENTTAANKCIHETFPNVVFFHPDLCSCEQDQTYAAQATPTPPTTYDGTQLIYGTDAIYKQTQRPVDKDNVIEQVNKMIRDYDLVQVSAYRYDQYFNCHSYAWYSQARNDWWFQNTGALKYMNDSYVQKVTGAVLPSDRITYEKLFEDNPTHSGIIVLDKNKNQKVRSKWGVLGVYDHDKNNVPYTYGSPHAYYRINR